MSRSTTIQCTNIFKSSENIRLPFNQLWAEIITLAENSKSINPGLEKQHVFMYNRTVQSYSHLNGKEVE